MVQDGDIVAMDDY